MHAVKTLIYIWPLYMRFMQNMRQQYDSIQRREKSKKAVSKIVPTEMSKDEHRKSEEDKVVSFTSNDDEEDVFSSSAKSANNESSCSPRRSKLSSKLSEMGRNAESTTSKVSKVPPRRFLSHSESMSNILSPRQANTTESNENYLCGKFKKFVFSYMLIWPYSYNALKYFLSILVVIFGAYPPQSPDSLSYKVCYLTLAVVSTLYSTYWDFRNDWGLFQWVPPKRILREKIYYGNTEYFYYIVLVLNPIFRFFWTLSFTPYGHHPFLACFEIFRRSLWACLRMENEYIKELKKRSHIY